MNALLLIVLLQTPSGKITATIENPRDAKGKILCNLHNSAAAFPGKSKVQGRSIVATQVSSKTVCEFLNVPAGTWAVSVLHDENGNETMDSNFLGMPKEGYGVSNNVLSSMSAPKWDDAKFVIAEAEARALSIKMKY